MVEDRPKRRLAAILASDVVGFSRLMEVDEAGTLAALRLRRKNVLDPLVAKHQGRIFKVTGDGVLVEFASAVNAVQCAVDLQEGMAAANADLLEDHHIVLRIGVNLGDVMVEGSDLYGDGVNIAARLEALAEPGGILVSGTAHDHIGTKVRVGFEDLGTQTLKNIAQPVRTYRVTSTPAVAIAAPKAVSDKPSIAVLPFTNMSGDPEQEYFADGLTEDFITELSRYKELHVAARHTSFHYKGSSPKVTDLRRELGVQYVLEGSIRKAGNRVRVTAQLIETAGGSHVWANRYDRDLSDIFAVQDELIAAIAATVEGRMVAAGAAQAQRKPTQNWSAYDCFLRGRELANAHKEREAMEFFAKAIQIDSGFAQAQAMFAISQVVTYFSELQSTLLQRASSSAERALTLDSSDANSHHAMGMVCLYSRQLDRAGTHFNRAASLNPHDVTISGDRANWLRFAGRLEEALDAISGAIGRDAYPPVWLFGVRGAILFHMRRYREAVDDLSNMQNRESYNVTYNVAALGQLSDTERANREVDVLRNMKPSCTISSLTSWLPFADKAMHEHLCDSLRKAGLPE
jgi:adenylate cyclase